MKNISTDLISSYQNEKPSKQSLPLYRHKCHFLKIIAFQLFQEMRSQFHAAFQHSCQSLLERHLLNANEVPQDHHSPQLQHGCMNKNLAPFFYRTSYEPVRQSEKLFSILLITIMQVNVQVLKVMFPPSVLFWSHIENMCYPHLQQMLGLKACNKVAVA